MRILFFDGVCGLCNGLVDFIIKIDHQKNIYYAPLQGEEAQKILGEKIRSLPDYDTVYFKDELGLHKKSTAILRLLYTLGGWWKLSAFALIIPKFLRDLIYDYVAKNRYKFFGKKETCRLPSSEERQQFLL